MVKRRQARYEAEQARRVGKAARAAGKGKATAGTSVTPVLDDAELERLTAPPAAVDSAVPAPAPATRPPGRQ